MAVHKMIGGLSVLALLYASSTATPFSPYEPYNDLLPRQGFDQPCGWNRPRDDPCPGMYYSTDGKCGGNATAVAQAITDAGLIAHAALRALYNPNATNIDPNASFSGASVNPAQHYFYFFDNDKTVAAHVASIFQNLADCADGRNCPNNLILCGDQRFGASQCDRGQYGYVLDPNQHAATINNQPKGGGVVFLCNAGMALPSNPLPCSTAGGAPGIGYALLYQMVQVDVIARPDTTYLEQKTGYPNITQLVGSADGKTSLQAIGWGTSGDGLKGKGLANAENYAR
ncbi:MAG: hypothetical protein LQ352_008047, partial [Teloschistes flavicans]